MKKVEKLNNNLTEEELERHLESLVKIYVKKPSYPHKIIGVFGAKVGEDYLLIKNEDELIGRIKMLMFLLNVKSLTTGKGYELRFGGKE